MAKDKPQDNIIKIAAEIGAKTAIDVYAKQKEKEKKIRIDRRLRDTKRLMRSYREIKVHAGDAISSLSETVNDDYEFFKELMEEPEKLDVGAIVRSKARSAIMLTHIDAMPFMQLYRDFSDKKTQYSKEWNAFQRSWSRPAAINAHMKRGTDFRNYNT